MRKAIVVAAVLVGVVAAPASTASGAPVELTFAKANQGGGVWSGNVAGDIEGGLTTELRSIRVSDGIWHVEFDWIVAAGDESFTARLTGIVNTHTGGVVMNGRVVEGHLLGARVAERGQLVNAAGDAVGTIRIMPATAR